MTKLDLTVEGPTWTINYVITTSTLLEKCSEQKSSDLQGVWKMRNMYIGHLMILWTQLQSMWVQMFAIIVYFILFCIMFLKYFEKFRKLYFKRFHILFISGNGSCTQCTVNYIGNSTSVLELLVVYFKAIFVVFDWFNNILFLQYFAKF